MNAEKVVSENLGFLRKLYFGDGPTVRFIPKPPERNASSYFDDDTQEIDKEALEQSVREQLKQAEKDEVWQSETLVFSSPNNYFLALGAPVKASQVNSLNEKIDYIRLNLFKEDHQSIFVDDGGNEDDDGEEDDDSSEGGVVLYTTKSEDVNDDEVSDESMYRATIYLDDCKVAQRANIGNIRVLAEHREPPQGREGEYRLFLSGVYKDIDALAEFSVDFEDQLKFHVDYDASKMDDPEVIHDGHSVIGMPLDRLRQREFNIISGMCDQVIEGMQKTGRSKTNISDWASLYVGEYRRSTDAFFQTCKN